MPDSLSKMIYLSPDEIEPALIQVEADDIDLKQRLVGGLFDIICPADYDITGAISKYDIFVNDNMLDGSFLPNVALNKEAVKNKDYNHACIIFGPLIVAGADEEGNTVGVDSSDIDEIVKTLKSHLLQNEKRKNNA